VDIKLTLRPHLSFSFLPLPYNVILMVVACLFLRISIYEGFYHGGKGRCRIKLCGINIENISSPQAIESYIEAISFLTMH
jgi:hypothetical protein